MPKLGVAASAMALIGRGLFWGIVAQGMDAVTYPIWRLVQQSRDRFIVIMQGRVLPAVGCMPRQVRGQNHVLYRGVSCIMVIRQTQEERRQTPRSQ